MSKRYGSRVLLEGLESRLLMAADAGSFLVATPLLSSQTYLLSQFVSAPPVQLAPNVAISIALSLQSGSSLDLTGTTPTAGLVQQFVPERTATPSLLPDSMTAAVPVA